MCPVFPSAHWCCRRVRCSVVASVVDRLWRRSISTDLSSTVLYQGNPLPGGRITFLPRDSRQNPVPAYRRRRTLRRDASRGEVTIVVDNREWKPVAQSQRPSLPQGIQMPGNAEIKPPTEPKPVRGKARGEILPIPATYYQAETSELKHTVKSGTENAQHRIKVRVCSRCRPASQRGLCRSAAAPTPGARRGFSPE